jgi:tetratricopeptide (TPR) repeat protein
VRSRSSSDTDEIKFVPAQPLANLLKLCDEHLECVVLNACYSDVQGDAISANIPFTIGMRDLVEDNVAIKFSQGFYDAIGAGKGYESAFKWGKVAIEFDLANNEASQILVLRKNESFSPVPSQTTLSPPNPQRSLSATEYFNRALEKQNRGYNLGALDDYTEAICLKPELVNAYYNRGLVRLRLGDKKGAISDYNHVQEIDSDFTFSIQNRLFKNIEIVEECISTEYSEISIDAKFLHLSKNWKKLEYFLQKQKWQEANSQTIGLLLALGDSKHKGWLSGSDIQNIITEVKSREVVKLIDQLWVNYSESTLGFSIQRNIVNINGEGLGNDMFGKLGRQFGWCFTSGEQEYCSEYWTNSETINWINPQMTLGHLPYLGHSWLLRGSPSWNSYKDFILYNVNCSLINEDSDSIQSFVGKSTGICDVVSLWECI